MFDAIDRLVHTGDPDAAVHQLRRLLVLHPALQPAYARLAELTGDVSGDRRHPRIGGNAL